MDWDWEAIATIVIAALSIVGFLWRIEISVRNDIRQIGNKVDAMERRFTDKFETMSGSIGELRGFQARGELRSDAEILATIKRAVGQGQRE